MSRGNNFFPIFDNRLRKRVFSTYYAESPAVKLISDRSVCGFRIGKSNARQGRRTVYGHHKVCGLHFFLTNKNQFSLSSGSLLPVQVALAVAFDRGILRVPGSQSSGWRFLDVFR